MRKFLFWNPGLPGPGERFDPLARNVSYLMLFALLAGVLGGSVVGLFSPLSGLPADAGTYVPAEVPAAQSPLYVLWSASRYFLLLLLLSTSWLGVLLTPAAVCLRGYLLSCSVSALFSAWAYRGLLYSLIVSGIPALFVLPCFLLAACDAFFASRRICSFRFGHRGDPGRGGSVRHTVLFAAAIVFEVLYRASIMPALLAKI